MLSRLCISKINSQSSKFRRKIIFNQLLTEHHLKQVHKLCYSEKNLLIQVEDKTTILRSKISYFKQLEAKPVRSHLCICSIIMNQTVEFEHASALKFPTEINVFTGSVCIRLIPRVIFSTF